MSPAQGNDMVRELTNSKTVLTPLLRFVNNSYVFSRDGRVSS
jgi:hypothetical protein